VLEVIQASIPLSLALIGLGALLVQRFCHARVRFLANVYNNVFKL
jgi:hypothetical protein